VFNILFNPTDDLPVVSLKQAINRVAEGIKCSAAVVSVLSAMGAIFFMCGLTDIAALCLFLVACGSWTLVACILRYETHIKELYRLADLALNR
jgi:hypothetical protein